MDVDPIEKEERLKVIQKVMASTELSMVSYSFHTEPLRGTRWRVVLRASDLQEHSEYCLLRGSDIPDLPPGMPSVGRGS